jgi:hypothetical protein
MGNKSNINRTLEGSALGSWLLSRQGSIMEGNNESEHRDISSEAGFFY